MYKILIADDEKNIRLGIQAMINREFPDTFETAVAADGIEALDMMEENAAHILITDIKMPRMSGIELIKELQQSDKQKSPALVILSGYDDFVYSKEAIKANVKDYLLKPVNRIELFNTLNSIVEEFESAGKSANQFLEEYRTSQLNYMLLNPNVQNEDFDDFYEKMQVEPFHNGYYIGIIKSDEKDLLSKVSKFLRDNEAETLSFLDSESRTVIITPSMHLFSELQNSLSSDSFVIGLSNKADDIKDMKSVYEQAENALKYHFFHPRSTIIFYDEAKEKQSVSDVPVDNIKKISNMLGTEREDEIKSLLGQVMDYETISSREIEYMENLAKEMNDIIFVSFFARLGEESVETFNLFNKISNIFNFRNFHEYFQALENLLMRLHEYNKQMKSVYSEQKYMDKAIAYIKENYHKDLNLAVVSNYISLNYSYFSHMFKDYTGQNFVDYLKNVRIEEAKSLLGETDLKVFEISEKVGYKNPKQFARVFREIEGISPKEYREKN
ncbi:response regulator [Fictibacillus aquaticus]|uniref:DNA-binding response regulator n=1 Tax=Fictibacillus aquaticus TaxID=2021314 RepID=A0A235F658_9BACL|nr:response regulator [Fictibacillus aquaticus]OYD56678.1 hypothetical protein CGZ90_16855 [Fictibacillus aquaticus]